MKQLFVILICLLLGVCLLEPKAAFAGKNHKLRLIYVEGGEYTHYPQVFRFFAQNLQELGLIENGDVPIPADSESMETPWQWMAKNAGGNHIEFLADGFYSGRYNVEKSRENIEAIKKRIQERHDVDVILSFGTRASRETVKLNTDIPVIVTSVTDAIGSKLVRSAEDSGKDNVVAIIPVHEHGIISFHDIFNFKKLGIAYEDTVNGRDVIGLSNIEQAATERNIQLLRCPIKDINLDDHVQSAKKLGDCHKKLLQEGAEAIFLTTMLSLTPKNAEEILEPVHEKRIPTFSQVGNSDVKYGALMSISENSFADEGNYLAYLITKIMAGAKPRSLKQTIHIGLSLTINLRTAAKIGWNPPVDVLAAVDEFYP